MDGKTMLAYMTGSIDAELLRRHEYLAAEDHILRAHIVSNRVKVPLMISSGYQPPSAKVATQPTAGDGKDLHRRTPYGPPSPSPRAGTESSAAVGWLGSIGSTCGGYGAELGTCRQRSTRCVLCSSCGGLC